MSWTRRRFLVAGAAALTSGCATRVGGTPRAGDSLPPAKPIRLAASEYRPYMFYDDAGGFTGQVPEIFRAVLAKMGHDTVEIETVPFDTLLITLDAETADIAGGLGITPERCATHAFSIPDHVARTALLVPKGNPKGLATYTEVVATGARLGLMAASLEVDQATAAGVPASQQMPLTQSVYSLIDALVHQQIDCAAYDDITLRDEIARSSHRDALEVLKPFTPPGVLPWVGAFAFRKADSDLRERFDDALRDLHDSGEWLRIARKFSFTDSNVPGPDLTTEQACKGR